jgi:hypothetical protein
MERSPWIGSEEDDFYRDRFLNGGVLFKFFK